MKNARIIMQALRKNRGVFKFYKTNLHFAGRARLS